MNAIVLGSLLTVSALNLLLELILGVEDGILSLTDVHLGHRTASVLLSGNNTDLVPVIFEFTHYLHDRSF